MPRVRSPPIHAADLSFSVAIDDVCERVEAHRRAVAIGDGKRAIGGRIRELPVGLDRVRALRAVERSGRQIDVAGLHGGRDLVDAETDGREPVRIELDPHGVFLLTVDLHLRNARQRRDALREQALGVLVHLRDRQRRRRQRQQHDGRIGRDSLCETRAGSASRAEVGARPSRSPSARPAPRRRCCGRARTAA